MSGPFLAAGSRRNFGWGRDPMNAARLALHAHYGQGRYATVAAHVERFSVFAAFLCDELGIRDMARNSPQVMLESFARHIARHLNGDELAKFGLGVMQPSYAQNLISSAQVALRALTGDMSLGISPVRYIGRRCHVRQTAPKSLDRKLYESAKEALEALGLDRQAAIAGLAREFGMRRREAALADLPRLTREAADYRMVNIIDGTKGGRKAPRWVPVTPAGHAALMAAVAASPTGSRNLVAPDETWRDFKDGELRRGLLALKAAGISGFHDFRAGYACERYRQLSGEDAPCVTGKPPTNKEADRKARDILAYELGHGRRGVTAAYAGGTRWRS